MPKWVMGVFSALLAATIIGAFGAYISQVAWSAQADERMKANNMLATQAYNNSITASGKITALEVKVDTINNNVSDIKVEQKAMNDKLDRLLERR